MKSLIFATVAASAFALGGTDSAEAGSFYFGVGSGPRGTRIYGHSGPRVYRDYYYRGPHSRHHRGRGHYDYYPGGFYRHGHHYDYVPGHYHWHPGRGHGHHHHH
ncbi:MAG: hypothetical protein ACF8PG_06015 [Maioricimonas sp. JB045]|uniref:hypothetical protein n=1 Tax=Maioricimonas sp. JC845 TaxID=3232138 RepID=UPI00345766E1